MTKTFLALVALLAGLLWAEAPPGGVPGNLPGFSASPSAQAAPAAVSAPQEQPKQQAIAPAPAKTGGDGSAGEYVIKGEGRMSMESEKPALNVTIEENKSIDPVLETEKELVQKSPPQISDIKEVAPVRQESDFVIVPSFKEFRQDSIAHEFHPFAELRKIFEEPNAARAKEFARWDFKVADANGRIFYSAAGKGMPPQNITVFTTNEKGDTVRVGSPYSGVLSYSDSYGSPHTVICESFSLSGLIHKVTQGYSIHLSLSNIFTKKESSEVSADGKKLAKETADWIKTKGGSQAPLVIEVFARNPAQAQAQADILASQMAPFLKRIRKTIGSEGKNAASGLDEHIEISIFTSRN